MMKTMTSTALALFLGTAACADDTGMQNRGATDDVDLGALDDSEKVALSGAIFTTLADGTAVDFNIYDHKCDVYLNGGPSHPGSAGLPEGDYVFMVTTPSGGVPSELLSTDHIYQRQFHVDATGRISGLSGLGDHVTSTNLVDGGVTIQLCPMLDTTNPGCEYKVWVTPLEDYHAGTGVFGFDHSRSKTDNFKVCEEIKPPPPPDAGPCEDENCDE